MLCGNLMPRTNDAALEQAKCGLDPVRRNVSVNVKASRVIDALMLPLVSGREHRAFIREEVVSHNHVNIFADVLSDVLRKGAGLAILSMEEAKLSTALLDANDDLLFLDLPRCPR